MPPIRLSAMRFARPIEWAGRLFAGLIATLGLTAMFRSLFDYGQDDKEG